MCGCDRSCMLRLNLSHDPAAPLQILCLGAHSDDIEIGCGGTILQLLSCYSNLQVWWIVFSAGTGKGTGSARQCSEVPGARKEPKSNREEVS